MHFSQYPFLSLLSRQPPSVSQKVGDMKTEILAAAEAVAKRNFPGDPFKQAAVVEQLVKKYMEISQ